MTKCQNIYGTGNARIIISQIIQNYFNKNIQNSYNNINYTDILDQHDNYSIKSNNDNNNNNQNDFYDIVIVLTAWKRNNLDSQLYHVKSQSILRNKKTNIIIFQNSNHINVEDIVNKWKQSDSFSDDVVITFIQSPIETGYFGRFIAPLLHQ